MKISGIYLITCLVNFKVYIGSSIDIHQRWRDHKSRLRRNAHKNVMLQRAWNKYREENFSFEFLELCDFTRLETRENYYIYFFNSSDRSVGYNLTEQCKAPQRYVKNRKSLTGRVFTESHKLNISKGLIGKRKEKAHIEKIAATKRGVALSDEHKQKLSAANKGKPKTELHKQKIKEALLRKYGQQN